MKTIKTIILTIGLLLACVVDGGAVNVKVNADKSIQNSPVVAKIEHTLGALLSEINDAQKVDRPLNLAALNLGTEARTSLEKLWVVSHFYCDDDEVTDRLWNFKNGYMVRSVPLIMTPDASDSFGSGTFQEAVVEFDKQGNVSDFRFSFSSRMGESLEKCSGSAVDIERKLKILSWCDKLATAYNQHNMTFMQKIFSDKALIITGHIVNETNSEFGTTNQKVVFNKQTKHQYLMNLARCFAKNKVIKVEFDEVGIGGDDGGCATVTRSTVNDKFYGVRLHQKWQSSNYSDEGYVFLLWNFTNDDAPQIEVRTWQPDIVNGKKISVDEIISLGDFESDIMEE